jgi:hypothetical protein
MQEEIIELAVQGLLLLVYTVAAAGFSALGVLFEYRSYLFSNSGDLFLAVWLGGLGLLMFGFAALISRDKLPAAYSSIR